MTSGIKSVRLIKYLGTEWEKFFICPPPTQNWAMRETKSFSRCLCCFGCGVFSEYVIRRSCEKLYFLGVDVCGRNEREMGWSNSHAKHKLMSSSTLGCNLPISYHIDAGVHFLMFRKFLHAEFMMPFFNILKLPETFWLFLPLKVWIASQLSWL